MDHQHIPHLLRRFDSYSNYLVHRCLLNVNNLHLLNWFLNEFVREDDDEKINISIEDISNYIELRNIQLLSRSNTQI